MSTSSNGRGTASDAAARTGQASDPRDLADYHQRLADEAETSVKNTRQTIKALEQSLKGREAEAEQHRKAAKRARADQED